MKRLMICLLLALSGCADRTESMVYTSETLPRWIVKEWKNAQDELLWLPNIPEDPRRYSPYQWRWVQLENEFWHTVDDLGTREYLRGVTQTNGSMQIIICCGDREVVRHEAFHAILWLMSDPRYKIHYPQLKKELR